MAIVRLVDGEVDLERHEVRRAGADPVALTAIEARLLEHLHAHGDRVVDRAEILSAVWGYAPASASQAVHVAVRRLRRKLEVDPNAPVHLVTVAGRGWRLAPAAPPPESYETSALIGRPVDLQRVQRELLRPGLVTLVGTGGVGKTTLARSALLGEAKPVFFVDCTEARDEATLDAQVRSALGERSGGVPTGAALASREPAVLVLDNLEQVIEVARGLVLAWREAAPGISMLATSRIALGIAEERVIGVDPLAETDGVRLLEIRAREAGAQWQIDDDCGLLIVRLLDALPLAIELAAARAPLFGPRELALRLARGIDVLRQGARHERHRTLHAVVRWSWDLLDADARRALAQLTVFRGGFSATAAEAVLDSTEPLDQLGSLVAHSLVRRDGPRERFDLFAAVREAVKDELPDARDSARQRHAAWFASMGTQERIDALDGPHGAILRARAVEEAFNLAAAARHSLLSHRPTLAAPAARLLAILAAAHALSDAMPLLRDVIAAPGLEAKDRALLEVNLAVLLQHAFESVSALAVLASAEGRTDDPRVRAIVGLSRANLHLRRCEHTEAEAAAREGLSHAVRGGLTSLQSMLVSTLASIALERGDRAAALPLYEQAEAGFRAAGDLRRSLITAGNRATTFASAGQFVEAQTLLEEVLAQLDGPQHDERSVGVLWVTYANVLRDRQHLDEARVALERGLGHLRRSGDLTQMSTPLALLAEIHLDAGELDAARTRANEALAISRRSGDRYSQSRRLLLLARIALRAGDTEQARHLLTESERRAGSTPLASVAREQGELRSALSSLSQADRSVG